MSDKTATGKLKGHSKNGSRRQKGSGGPIASKEVPSELKEKGMNKDGTKRNQGSGRQKGVEAVKKRAQDQSSIMEYQPSTTPSEQTVSIRCPGTIVNVSGGTMLRRQLLMLSPSIQQQDDRLTLVIE
ncbi:hypothetical protein SARC_08700 [Sphaeroforma arctica JP610]|uniref:Uncharacterized protein n=1 Tax=Sphaeroforma arctica JP610 TaxID=667725 RepID=A0A0L0FQA2_9EUKA|nr:hypothetical protein SARC_08700 [Sphaeroforma arctica JP610]KNC78884.1 hypothetical protein SARC_08700 [Sphaeroforma arctica JP610]|eukprot:XP_014152786.1 hypothetical protein SARC_08700 [Sphaeroforma arctica JP610]